MEAVNSEAVIGEPGRIMVAVVPNPCPRLDMSMVPPLARMKVDAIQNPRPDPGIVA